MDNRMYAVGADVGGSHISSAVIDLASGNAVTDPIVTDIDSRADACTVIDAWCGNIIDTLSAFPHDVNRVGMALPGPFDYHRGISLIKGVNKFDNLFGLDVRMSIHSRLSGSEAKEIRFVNDASAFALGEALGGSARDRSDVVALTLGTGVGSGFVRNRQLVETGDTVPANGWVYNLPFDGSIADDAFSTRWIIGRYSELTGVKLHGAKDVAARYESDAAARRVFDEFGARLASFVIPVMERFGSSTLVLGGNISRSLNLFRPAMEAVLAKEDKNIEVFQSSLFDRAALIGAAALFFDK